VIVGLLRRDDSSLDVEVRPGQPDLRVPDLA
jgi:hypothetical protein